MHYGDNFIALGIRGMDGVRLFFMQRPGNTIRAAHENYQEFVKERGPSA
jgi:hypothetical protein